VDPVRVKKMRKKAIAQHAQALAPLRFPRCRHHAKTARAPVSPARDAASGFLGGAKLEAARLTAIESLASKGGEIAPDALHDIRFFATTTPSQAATIRAADWLRQARPPENKKSYRACCVTAPDRLDQRIAENWPGSVRC
jgi:hypothetical protein